MGKKEKKVEVQKPVSAVDKEKKIEKKLIEEQQNKMRQGLPKENRIEKIEEKEQEVVQEQVEEVDKVLFVLKVV